MANDVASVRLWLIGDASCDEWRHVLRTTPEPVSLRMFSTVDEATRELRQTAMPPELVAVVQSRPGEFSDRDVWRLYCAAPLVRVIAIVGSWCDRALRLGAHPAGTHRVPWHEWESHIEGELARLESGAPPTWSGALSASDDQRLLEIAHEGPKERAGLVVIATNFGEAYAYLSDACRASGLASVWVRHGQAVPTQGASAAIWDAAQCDDAECRELARFCRQTAAPTLALVAFPRFETLERVQQSGAEAMLAKPVLIQDLWHQLERLMLVDADRRGSVIVERRPLGV